MKRLAILVASLSVAALAADSVEVFGHTWTVPTASDWKVGQEDGGPVLRLTQGREPVKGPRRPFQFALADVQVSGAVTVEADVMPLGGSLLIVFAYRDPAHFNYAHLSVDPGAKQPMHNGVFHIYGGERVRISSERGPAAFSASGRWHHVRLVHDPAFGTVSVTVDGQALPALQAVDLSLGAGKVGIGSFDETGAFKNVRIQAD